MAHYGVPLSPEEHVESRKQKLGTLMTELKLHDLNIKPDFKHALIGDLDRGLDAFAANDDDDIGHRTVVGHSNNTGQREISPCGSRRN